MATEAQTVTRDNFERRFLNATDKYTLWKILEEVLDHVDTIQELRNIEFNYLKDNYND